MTEERISPHNQALVVLEKSNSMHVLSLSLPCPDSRNWTLIRLNSLWLSQLFTDRTGLGTSGETYLIDEGGHLLTESRFTPTPSPAPVPKSIESPWRGLKADYRGISVLASWREVSWGSFHGYLASEIDLEEIELPLTTMKNYSLLLGLALLCFAIFFAPTGAKVLWKNLERKIELERVQNAAVVLGQERERKRISMEVHDDIGQRLSALIWRLSGQQDQKANKTIVTDLGDLSLRIRRLTHGLSTDVLDNLGLPAALKGLIADLNQMSSPNLPKYSHLEKTKRPNFELLLEGSQADFDKISEQNKLAVYRIFQEALTNILKHSKAERGHCLISCKYPHLEVTIEDDGIGIAQEVRTQGLGISNMKFRAETLGGKFSIESISPRGTLLKVRLPMGEIYEDSYH